VELLAEQVLGLEAVLPDGTVVQTRPVWKSSTGKDTINHLFLGMEGAYGVLTRLHVRLRALPEREQVALYGFADFKEACGAAWQLIRAGVHPVGLYVLDGPRATALMGSLPGDPDGVLVAYFGGVDGVVEAQRQALAAVCGRGTHLDEVADRWMLKRHYYVRAGRRQGGSVTGTLASFPRFTDFLTMVDRFRSLTDQHGFTDTYVGVMIYFGRSWMAASMLVGVDAHDPEVMHRHSRWQTDVLNAQLDLGGTADAVTSVGFWRADYMAAEHGNGHELLRLIKHTLDPGQILNRGIRALG
jgi:D-lactate dehydrogenase (cytochrome)